MALISNLRLADSEQCSYSPDYTLIDRLIDDDVPIGNLGLPVALIRPSAARARQLMQSGKATLTLRAAELGISATVRRCGYEPPHGEVLACQALGMGLPARITRPEVDVVEHMCHGKRTL